MGRSAENIEGKKKVDRRKTLKSKRKRKKIDKYEESEITTIYIFGFTFYIKSYILFENIV